MKAHIFIPNSVVSLTLSSPPVSNFIKIPHPITQTKIAARFSRATRSTPSRSPHLAKGNSLYSYTSIIILSTVPDTIEERFWLQLRRFPNLREAESSGRYRQSYLGHRTSRADAKNSVKEHFYRSFTQKGLDWISFNYLSLKGVAAAVCKYRTPSSSWPRRSWVTLYVCVCPAQLSQWAVINM